MSENLARLDFETRSSADLKKIGAHKYSQDPSTRILCLSYQIPGQSVKLWHPECGWAPTDLFFWIEDGGLCESHNFEFELCIWNNVARRFFQWPKLLLAQGRCSAAKAAALGLPRALEGLCDVLNTDIKKDKDGKKIMLRLSKLKKPSKKDPEFFDDDPEKRKKLFEYCVDDVLAESAASAMLPDLDPRSQRFWQLTAKINERGIYCDTTLCRRGFEFSKHFERDLLAELKILTDGQVKTARQVEKLKEFLASEGLQAENLQAKNVTALLKMPGLSFRAKRALEIRAMLSKSSISKFTSMINMAGVDNRIRGTLLFHGASTGRYTGRGIQPQNFPRGNAKDVDAIFYSLENDDYEDFKEKFPNVFEALSNSLRGMLRAAPGNELFAADFAAIETRGAFWLAGHKQGLDSFYRDEDIYAQMAKAIYELTEDEWKLLEKIERTLKRQLGKQAILGLGYGMGAKKFVITCANYGIYITEEFAQKVVKLYRAIHWPVPALWADVERAAINAVERPGKIFTAGKCQFSMRGRFLFIKLPSGRKLAYRDPSIQKEDSPWGERSRLGYHAPNSLSKKWQYEQTYGGKLVENITQAVCADLLLEAQERLEAAGYPVILSVHDEIISELPKGQGDLKEFEKIMGELPAWAEGFPMKLEGWQDVRYKK